jgi:CBS-domain-containing membrane protein
MIKEQVKVLPVVDEKGHVVGILTDEDLTERAGIRQRLSIALRMDRVDLDNEIAALSESPLRVSEIMTAPVVTALDSETLGAAANRLIKNELKRLPVVNTDGKLVGMLARLDVLRQMSHATVPPSNAALPKGAVRVVSDVMLSNIPMVLEDDTLSTVVEKFAQSISHRLIVINAEGKVTGLVSDSDVVTRAHPSQKSGILDALKRIGKPPAGKETAADLMSPGVLAVGPDTPITTAVKQMMDEGRKWMVVVDENGKPLGLVDRQVLLRSVTPHFKS